MRNKSVPLVTTFSNHTFLPGYLPSEPTIIDFGANQGAFLREVSKIDGARIFAAEPDPELFNELQSAVPKNAELLDVAITGDQATVTLNIFKSRCASIERPLTSVEDFVTATVRGMNISEFLRHFQVTHVDLLKMDIEGAELSAIGQASDGVLLSISQITVEFHGFLYPETEEQISKTKERLQSLGFTAIDFSRWRNGDVLFLNPNLNVGLWDLARLWSYKYGTGAWRMLKRWLR